MHGAPYGVADDAHLQVRQIIAIHLQQPPGDILVFMTGQVLYISSVNLAWHGIGCGRLQLSRVERIVWRLSGGHRGDVRAGGGADRAAR